MSITRLFRLGSPLSPEINSDSLELLPVQTDR